MEKSGGDDLSNDLGNFFSRRPDVTEHDGVSILIHANGINLEVDIDGTGDSVGDDKRGRGKVVGTGVGRDTALEVSVS